MIFISIENADIAGQAITVTDASGDERVRQNLRPGESAKIAFSRTTLLSLSEIQDPPRAHIEAR